MKKILALVVGSSLLLAGAGWAGEGGWGQSGVTEPELSVAVIPIPPSGVTAWYGGGDFIYKWYMDHYRHPWPVRWYDAVVKWLKTHLWWPVGEAEAGEYTIDWENWKGAPDPTAWKQWTKPHDNGRMLTEQVLIDIRPHFTYPQLTRIPWSEVNEFLRTEAKEGRAWEIVTILPVFTPNHNGGPHWIDKIWKHTYVILNRQVRE